MVGSFWRTPLYVLLGATCILLVTNGARQSFGLFIQPISIDLGWGREPISFAIAVQNLLVGLMAPFAAMIADRWGLIRVIAAGTFIGAVGLVLTSHVTTETEFLLGSGFLMGIGMSGCGLGLMNALVGRIAPEKRRMTWLGITTAGASMGQFIFVPFSQTMITMFDWRGAMTVTAVAVFMVAIFALSLRAGSAAGFAKRTQQSLGEALREAAGHRGYVMLVSGYFVCGLQVQFIATHLPAYLTDAGLPAALGAAAIATIGLFNLFGAIAAGRLGDRFRMKYLLSSIYLTRGFVMLAFLAVPLSETSAMVFAGAMGLLWLSTVPLTTGLIVHIFGPRYMATLVAIAFMSHQLGSFLGVWLGGLSYDFFGSYDPIWTFAIAAGFVAALIHLPIPDKPLARVAGSTG
ncbi:MAG: MFS transporter [Alphaproteobacteria bacterium]